MRSVYFSDQRWFFSKKGNFQGLRTGSDACAEHEVGMKPIQQAFGLDLTQESMERFRITRAPEGLHFFEATFDKTDFVGIIFCPNSFTDHLTIAEGYKRHCIEDNPVVAWDEKHFLIMVPATQKKYVKAIRALWNGIERGQVWLGGAFSHKFIGSGMGFFLSSTMPKEEVDAANLALQEQAEEKRKLDAAVASEDFDQVAKELREAGRDWFYLGPKKVREDGSVHYWLNPMDQANNHFGFVTIDDLRHWVKGKGRIPNRMAD